MKTGTGKFIKSLVIITVAAVSGLSLYSCATLKKDECLNADWFQIGYEDGAMGYPASRVGSHRKACAGFEVTPDLEAYLDGRNMGLNQFCTPRNGYRMGLSGKTYLDQCREHGSDAFLTAFNRGKDVYRLKKEIRRKKKAIKDLDAKIQMVEEQIIEKERDLSENCANKKKCRKILDKIRELDHEKERLEYEIERNFNQAEQMRQTLRDMEEANRIYQ